MDIQKLQKEFLINSTSKDLDVENLDSKHKKIIANSQKNLKNLSNSNFRNWTDQNDMGLRYPMTYFSKVFLGNKKNNLLNFFFKILKKRINHYFEFSSMLDDIEIIKNLGGEYLLNENPQNKTPGAINFPLVNKHSVSFRWLRYIYILNQIINYKLINNNSTWVDIGSYYGGLQGLVKKYYPESKIIMVDFNHQLTRSYIYLKQLYPEANHVFPNEISSIKSLESLPKGSILYVEIADYEKLNNFKFNLTTNFFSLGEMKKNTFKKYIESPVIKNSDHIYFANRFCSSPLFEKTYDDSINIFDYKLNQKRTYFDIFPISHFQITLRNILKRTFFRNISSPYFEMISKK